MSQKAIVVATVGRFYNFEKNDIKLLQELGYEVHVATNMQIEPEDNMDGFEVIKHQVDFARSPFSKNNIIAYKQLKELFRRNHFDIVHCHTPVGGIIARLVAKKYRKKGTKVIYTAHGFHFYKGSPKINWIVFYPLEKIFSMFTDVIITINKDDFSLAVKKFKAKSIEYIPGVGVNIEKFDSSKYDTKAKREELGVTDNEIMALSVGELSVRKNHDVVIKAISKLPKEYLDRIKYFIVGKGDLEEYLKKLCNDFHLDNVSFLGYRTDIPELCTASDLFIFPSLQEGLPVALMEAMSSGLPIVCSRIRGNVDLIEDSVGGFLYDPNDIDGFEKGIMKIMNSTSNVMGEYNANIMKKFSLDVVQEKMIEIYSK